LRRGDFFNPLWLRRREALGQHYQGFQAVVYADPEFHFNQRPITNDLFYLNMSELCTE
jgi:hypothetical protein